MAARLCAWLFGPGRRPWPAAILNVDALVPAAHSGVDPKPHPRWSATSRRSAIPALLILGVPHNIAEFEDTVFSPDHHDHQGRLILNVLRHPAAANAPDRLRPDPDVFNSQSLTVGFLRRAATEGKLPEVSGPIPPTSMPS